MRLVCVTGMHRSGTSLAVRILNLLGVDLGPDDALMPATESNPRGHWEAEPIVALDDEVLRRLGGGWKDVPAFRHGWEADPGLDDLRGRAQSVVAELFGSADLAGFKDPRASLLLPFWRTVAPVETTIIVLREPAEVADSLARRDGLDAERSAGLWLDYVASAWTNSPGRIALTYADLLADPVDVARRLARRLELAEPDTATMAAIEDFRDPALRRSRGEHAPVGPVMAAAESLYALLTSPVAERADGLVAALAAERSRTRVLQTDVRRLEEQHDTIEGVARRREEERDTARRDAERWRDEFERLRDRRAVRLALRVSGLLRPGRSDQPR